MNLARTARRAAISALVMLGTFCTIMAMAIGVQSCAWFDKHVDPVVKPIASCAGQSVSAADFQEAVHDLQVKDYGDLSQLGIRLGWDVLGCIVDNIGAQDPSLKVNGDEFKAQHAKQIEDANKPSTASTSTLKIDERIAWSNIDRGVVVTDVGALRIGGQRPERGKYSYAGESVAAASSRCASACGGRASIGSPDQRCLCWHEDRKDQRRSHWEALPVTSPPGVGSGVVAVGGER